MARLTTAQRAYIRKRSKPAEPDPTKGELNIVPFLDIVVNIIMFLLMSMAAAAFHSQASARLPSHGPGTPTVNIHLMVTSGALTVASEGETTSIPRYAGEHDWHALRAHLVNLKRSHPDVQKITISGDVGVDYQDIITAMDTSRAAGPQELFPEVMMSAGIR